MRNAGLFSVLLLITGTPAPAAEKAVQAIDVSAAVSAEVDKGGVTPRVTSVEDFKAMFGPPTKEDSRPDGGGSMVTLVYPHGTVAEFKQMSEDGPATLLHLGINGRPAELGKPRLKTGGDLLKLDRFLGLADVSLKEVDLRQSGDLLRQLPFDSLTEWPSQDRLPSGFDPAAVMEKGKNPGLGVRQLHKDGIDGRGVGIAVIDQPLLLGHREYSSRLVYYNAAGLPKARVDMHGPSVASFAVGKDIGTAPGASLYYLAVPSWIPDNSYPAKALRAIVELNKSASAEDRIRVVSISHGAFKQRKNFDQWNDALRLAEENGILVISCDPSSIDFGNLTRAPDKDPDSPASYAPEGWDRGPHPLWVPGGNRTRASYKGETLYAFDPVGGRSWSTPYLAGVAALGFQVAPTLSPAVAKKLLIKSATPSKAGPILNPREFIEMARKSPAQK